MKYTTLGTTDLKISQICLGTMTWGNHNNQEEGHAQMDYALEQGVTFWDTSEMYAVPPTKETYGTTETIIGNWFEKNGRRDEVILASKISPELPYIRKNNLIDRPNILKAVDDSLTRLKTDYIDLYQLHWPSNRPTYHFNRDWGYTPTKTDKTALLANQMEVLETLDQLIKAGKIRHWGLSNETAWGTVQYCELAEKANAPKPASLQNEYSLMRRRDDLNISEICMIEGLSYLPWSPLAMGVLSGKYLGNAKPKGARLTYDELSQTRYGYRLTDNVEKATKLYVEVAKANDLDPNQMAIAFCLTRPFVTSPIIGATSLEQLTTNIGAINCELSKDVLQEIEKIYQQYPVPF